MWQLAGACLTVLVAAPIGNLCLGEDQAEVLPSLINTLKSNDRPQVQSALARLQALSKTGTFDSAQLTAIAHLLVSEQPFEAESAAASLLVISARQPQIFSEAVVKQLSIALRNATSDRLRCDVMSIICLLGEDGRPALNEARALSQSDSLFVKSYSLRAIACIDPSDKHSIATLQEWLTSTDENQRTLAAISLSAIGVHARSALSSLHECLRDESPAARVLSAQAIWRIESNSAGLIDVLGSSVEDPPVPVLYRPPYASEWTMTHTSVALLTLAEMAESNLEDILPIFKLALRSGEIETRIFAVKALSTIDDSQALALLQVALSDCSPAVRHVAREALAGKKT